MQPGVDQLRDIQGIDSIPWWPLAPGWWMLLGGLAVAALLAWRWRTVLRLRVPIPYITLGTWRWDAAAALRDLRRRAQGGLDAKRALGELSELLRRIAMARMGRDACAGLTGEAWLDWLAANDPQGFPWHARGRALLDIPYAPPGHSPGRGLYELIDAAYGWVSAPNPRPARTPEPGVGGLRGLLARLGMGRWRTLRPASPKPVAAGRNPSAPGVSGRSAGTLDSAASTATGSGTRPLGAEPALAETRHV